MIRIICLLTVFCLFASGCRNKIQQDTMEQKTTMPVPAGKRVNSTTEYWKAHGTEPFWSLLMHKDTFLLTRLSDKIDSTYLSLQDVKTSDTITVYHLFDFDKEVMEVRLEKSAAKCSDGMSDQQYGYNAIIHYKGLTMEGCAEKN